MRAIHINIIEVNMTTGLKKFGGRFEPKKSALEKNSTLPVYVAFKQTKNKIIAKTLLHADFIQFAPDYADDYFAPKVWEAAEGMFCTVEGQFYTDLFTGDIIWNAEKGEPELIMIEPELAGDNEQLNAGAPEEKMKSVKELDVLARAYCLAVFGAIDEITPSQYGQLIDMLNDDEYNSLREQAEAIAKESRVLALLPEKQTECLAWVRQKARNNAKWPDYKNLFSKWLDTPADKREPVKLKAGEPETGDETHTESGCTLGGGNVTDRVLPHTLATLRREVCIGILGIAMDFDIYELPHAVHDRAKKMEETGTDERFTAWWKQLRRTPGILDFSRAAIIALIKSSPEDIYRDPVKLREYINKNLTESDHANPGPLIVDIACGRTSAPLPQKNNEVVLNDQSEQTLPNETEIPAVCPSRAAELDRELDAAFANSASNEGEKTEVTEQEDDRPLLDDHEIEIAHALNDLLSGRTDIMGKEEAEGVVACTGHIIADVLPLLIIDIATTEFCLSPNFSDEEVHDVATTILDGWSDDAAVRQKIALDAIVEYRRPEPPKPVVMDPPVVTVKPKKEPETVFAPKPAPMALTYRQQLTLAALQGMCANPAYRGDFDELPHMAAALAAGVISAEAEQ
jgi:exodeoxyribonuclease VIII